MNTSHYETILTSLDHGVMTITMNRPDRLNAWTYQMGAELQQAIESGNDDPDVNVFVLTGAGRGFCAGADIKDLFKNQADSGDDGSNERPARDWVGLVRRAKPMIAAVNGAAVGVGLTQILPCDYIMAGPDAKFSARFVKMGVVPELASSYYLVARAGVGLWPDAVVPEKVETLRTGDASPAVAALQQALRAYGYELAHDGVFGPQMSAVISAFQRHFRASCVDGQADGETQTLIYAACRAKSQT